MTNTQFSTYIRNYMKAYPHIQPEEYPTFEDFDMNRDGLVTFQEW
jgi:phage anti-repressor protein